MRHALLLIVSLMALNCWAQERQFNVELDALATQRDLNELIVRVNQPRNADEVRQGLDWLRARTLTGFGGSRIFYSYAFGLFRTNVAELKDTASFIYLIGLLLGRADAARCADPSAPADKLSRWEQNLAPIRQHFVSLPLDERRKFVSMAVVAEKRLENRSPDAWLCNGGLAFMYKFAKKHKDNPTPPAREIQDETSIGRTVLLDDLDIKPEFISNEEWNAKRKQIVEKFVEQMPLVK
jgi:hypothetical protein